MILSVGLLLACCAGPNGIAANDTGGIIPWSPENQRISEPPTTIASELSARITSVHAHPGDYIGFTCVWSLHARP
jgi:hypothetical protein